jgi:hypothetical protein
VEAGGPGGERGQSEWEGEEGGAQTLHLESPTDPVKVVQPGGVRVASETVF